MSERPDGPKTNHPSPTGAEPRWTAQPRSGLERAPENAVASREASADPPADDDLYANVPFTD